MNHKRDLDGCRTADQFIRYAEDRGATRRNGGRHVGVRVQGRFIPVGHCSARNDDLPRGTAAAIRRAFIAAGLVVLLLVALTNMVIV